MFISTLLLFHFFRNGTANTRKSEVFLLRIYSGNVNVSVVTCDILKFTKKVLQKNFTFCALCGSCYRKKCSVSCIFQTIVVIAVIKIREKYLRRISVFERNFQKLFARVYSQGFNHKFLNIFFFEKQSHQLCLLFVVSQ